MTAILSSQCPGALPSSRGADGVHWTSVVARPSQDAVDLPAADRADDVVLSTLAKRRLDEVRQHCQDQNMLRSCPTMEDLSAYVEAALGRTNGSQLMAELLLAVRLGIPPAVATVMLDAVSLHTHTHTHTHACMHSCTQSHL